MKYLVSTIDDRPHLMRSLILALHDMSLYPAVPGMIVSGFCQRPWRIHPTNN